MALSLALPHCIPVLSRSSPQFTAKQLEKLSKKAEKDSKAEQAKVKKVGGAPPAGAQHCVGSWNSLLPPCGSGKRADLLPPLLDLPGERGTSSGTRGVLFLLWGIPSSGVMGELFPAGNPSSRSSVGWSEPMGGSLSMDSPCARPCSRRTWSVPGFMPRMPSARRTRGSTGSGWRPGWMPWPPRCRQPSP